jgi:hypothetical protein
MVDERILDEAICHALRVKTAKLAAGTLSRLKMVRAGVTVTSLGGLYAGSVGMLAILGETADRNAPKGIARD